MNSNCPFCTEFHNPEDSIWNTKRESLPLCRIIHENEDWVILPPLGSFVPCALLIISKEHYRSCACVPQEKLITLQNIISDVQRVLHTKSSNNILFFEHGPSCCGTKGACCVDHAHINVFPICFDIWHSLPENLQGESLTSINMLYKFSTIEYLWLFDSHQNMVFPTRGIPSQYIRTVIAKRMNVPERWNWNVYLGLEEIQKTMDILGDQW